MEIYAGDGDDTIVVDNVDAYYDRNGGTNFSTRHAFRGRLR
jgi:hypothetical protein